MPPSWRLALTTLASRRGRTALLGLTVVLAGALISGVVCALLSAQQSLAVNLDRFLGATDVRVVHPSFGRFDVSVLDTVRGWPEVEEATGRFGTTVVLRRAAADDDDGAPHQTTLAIGVDFDAEARFRAHALSAGHLPAAAGDALIGPLVAETLGVGPGDDIVLAGSRAPLRATVCGVLERQRFGPFQTAIAYVDRTRLADAAAAADVLTSIAIRLADGADVEAFCSGRTDDVPEALVLEPVETIRGSVDDRLRGIRIGLIVSSVLAYLSAAFIVLVGLTTGVMERQRELALLRCLGAARPQLFASQILVGVFFGTLAVVVGLPLGGALAAALVAGYPGYFLDGVVLSPVALGLAAAGAMAAGVLGALVPAVLATRVAPLAAMTRQGRPPTRRGIAACVAAGLALVLLAQTPALVHDPDARFWTHVAAGLPCAFLGWFLLAVPVLIVTGGVLAAPVARLMHVPAPLLRGSLLAAPYRHGFTAGALMVGMAILVSSWATGITVLRDWVDGLSFADGYVYRLTGIDPGARDAIAALDDVQSVCPIGVVSVRPIDRVTPAGRRVEFPGLVPTSFGPTGLFCVGFDADRFFAVSAATWIEGDPDRALPRLRAGDGVLVTERMHSADMLALGDRVTLASGRRQRSFEVVGVVSSDGLDLALQLLGVPSRMTESAVSTVFIDRAALAEAFDQQQDLMLLIDLAEGADIERAAPAIRAAAPGAEVYSHRWVTDTVGEIARITLAIHSAVAIGAMIVAAFAVAGVVLANVQVRRFEYGVLRASGAHRAMVLRLILGETALLAGSGAATGTLLGLQLAGLDILTLRDVAGLPVTLAVPWSIVGLGTAAIVATAVAFALPGAVSVARTAPAALVAVGRND